MSKVKNTQRQFLTTLLMTLMLFRGKATFRNLSRYSDSDEKIYARGFRRPFDLAMVRTISGGDSTVVT
jgi:hypothetical protein